MTQRIIAHIQNKTVLQNTYSNLKFKNGCRTLLAATIFYNKKYQRRNADNIF